MAMRRALITGAESANRQVAEIVAFVHEIDPEASARAKRADDPKAVVDIAAEKRAIALPEQVRATVTADEPMRCAQTLVTPCELHTVFVRSRCPSSARNAAHDLS